MQLKVMFTLTLTLSPREREPLSSGRDNSTDDEHFLARQRVLPLPEGEGWGEGEGALLVDSYD
jgi:hypothetical protein